MKKPLNSPVTYFLSGAAPHVVLSFDFLPLLGAGSFSVGSKLRLLLQNWLLEKNFNFFTSESKCCQFFSANTCERKIKRFKTNFIEVC